MPAISLKDARKRLAQFVATSEAIDLVEVYAELFPSKTPLDANAVKDRRMELVSYVETKIEPEEVADLWNVVFPDGPNFYYDEEERALRQPERRVRYAGY